MNNLIDNIKNLREITGAGFLDCKKALEENNNNIDTSIDFLRKKGLAKANLKLSREAKEGAVGIYSNDLITVVMQINTETDFAAKNDVFLNFMDEIGKYSLEEKSENLSINDFKNTVFNERSIDEHFKNIISKIGENIILSKLIFVKNNEGKTIFSYIHNPYKKHIGKIASLISVNVNQLDDDSKLLGKNLCMHIAASKPLSMDVDNLDASLVKKEKEVQFETIKSSGKPENILEKILEGKMQKFYSESTFLNQKYVMDPDKTVKEIVSEFSKNNKFDIIEYHLVVLGS